VIVKVKKFSSEGMLPSVYIGQIPNYFQ